MRSILALMLVFSFYACTHSESNTNEFMNKKQVEQEMSAPQEIEIMADEAYVERVNSLIPMDELFRGSEKSIMARPVNLDNAPEDIDLRDMDTPIKSQGSEGTCTAFGLTAAQEYAHCSINQECGLDLSERHRWNLYREYSAWEALGTIEYGISLEKFCPYSNQECYPVAKQEAKYIVDKYTQLPTKSHVIDALAKGKAVYFWSQTPQQMVNCAKTISSPVMADGGHAYKISGYFNKADPILIVKNSWGKGCADKGYQYMKFSVFDRAGYWEAVSIDSVSIEEKVTPKCRIICGLERKAKHFWEKRQYCKQVCL